MKLKNMIDAEYNIVPATGFVDKLLLSQRRKMVDAFKQFRQSVPDDTVLNIGMMPTPTFDGTNYLLAWSSAQDRSRIVSYEIESPDTTANHRHAKADGAEKADSIHLPFADNAFDWVFCNEVIERIGGYERQYQLVKELARVARKGVFVTTSNRWHPIEFNTSIPLIHWLPESWWRRILKLSGKKDWASNTTLNLLGSSHLYKMALDLPGKPVHDVGHKRVFGIKAHFFLMIQKKSAT